MVTEPQGVYDEALVERGAAWLHSWNPYATQRPWSALGPARKERLRAQARGILALQDGSMLSFPGDPGPQPTSPEGT